MTATFAAMVAAGFDLNLLVLDFPRADRCSDADWWPTVRAFEAALKTNGARGAIVASLPENLSEGHAADLLARGIRSEEHTSELQSLMRISYAVFCLKKKKQNKIKTTPNYKNQHT